MASWLGVRYKNISLVCNKLITDKVGIRGLSLIVLFTSGFPSEISAFSTPSNEDNLLRVLRDDLAGLEVGHPASPREGDDLPLALEGVERHDAFVGEKKLPASRKLIQFLC